MSAYYISFRQSWFDRITLAKYLYSARIQKRSNKTQNTTTHEAVKRFQHVDFAIIFGVP